jgi:hypothetical protein
MANDGDMGAAVFYEMSAALKRKAPDLRKQLHKQVRESAKPLLPKVRGSALARFPKRGGLNRHMAKGTRYRTVAKTGIETAGVSIRANRTDPRTDSQGRIAHPVPMVGGHKVSSTNVKTRKTTTTLEGGEAARNDKGKKVFAVQYFPEAVGYFRDPIEAGAVQVRRDLLDTLERWADDMGLR